MIIIIRRELKLLLVSLSKPLRVNFFIVAFSHPFLISYTYLLHSLLHKPLQILPHNPATVLHYQYTDIYFSQ